MCAVIVECWNPDPPARPVFSTVLDSLQLIAESSFVETPNLSFHVLQDDWRNEIEFMFEELRSKEQVSASSSVTHGPMLNDGDLSVYVVAHQRLI